MSFLTDLSEKVQNVGQSAFSNFTEVVTFDVLSQVPFVSVGKAPKSNLTSQQISSGMRGENINGTIPQREGIDSSQLKSGIGSQVSTWIAKIGTVGLVIGAIVIALIIRKRK